MATYWGALLFDTKKSFCPYSHAMFPPKYFDNLPPEGGSSEGLDAFRFFTGPIIVLSTYICIGSGNLFLGNGQKRELPMLFGPKTGVQHLKTIAAESVVDRI